MNGEALVRVGMITKPRGLGGELWVKPLTDDPERFRLLREVYIEKPDGRAKVPGTRQTAPGRFEATQGRIEAIPGRIVAAPGRIKAAPGLIEATPGKIKAARIHRGRVSVRIEGCGDVDAAQAYRGCYISVTREQLVELPEDSYFIFDLIGCAVYNLGGGEVGTITDVLETGSNDVYVVSPSGAGARRADLLVPALKTVVKDVDVAGKRVIIDYDPEEQ